jgi:transglutaminase-like putative cysteine protease
MAVAICREQYLPYIYPSRYCQSDRLHRLAVKEFGHLWHGYSRVQAIRDWVLNRVTFRSNSSTGNTTAVDTLVEEVGVCRDFAHLMIALCRAVNIPARFVTGIDYGADPILGPTDFHAYVEVFLKWIAGTSLILQESQFLWVLCAYAPDVMQPTRLLQPYLAECAVLRQ